MVPLYDFTGDPRRPQFDDPELDALAPGGRAGSARGVRLGPPASPAQALTSGVQFPPPDLVVYPSGSDLYAEGTSLAIANGTSGTVATFALGQANVGVINSWIIYGNNLTAALVATWQLIINGSTPAGGTRRVPPQTSAFGAIAWGPTEILFRLPAGAIISVLISVTAGGPADLGAQIGGHEYPTVVQDRYNHGWDV